MKTLRKIGNAILTGLLHAVFFLWGGVTRLLYFPRVEWTDKSAKDAMKQGAILISNHKSHKDGFLIPQMLPAKRIYVLVTRKWYDKKGLNPIFRRLRYIPIDLNSPDGDSEWMQKTEEVLKKGHSVLIFPEGKLEKDEVPEPFHAGFLLPARHLDVPVIPMATVGTYRPFHRQILRIGSPFTPALHEKGRLSQVLGAASEDCKNRVFSLRDGKTLPADDRVGV